MTSKLRPQAPVWLLTLLISYALILTALTVLNQLGADRWWFGALNLYLPQIVWAIPGIILTTITFKVARQWTWAPLLGVLWVMWWLMGFNWPLHTPQESKGSLPLRVMTWNVKYGAQNKSAHSALMHEIDRNKPTVIFMQDAGGLLDGPLEDYFSTWNVRSNGQYVVASRLPLGELQVRRMSFPADGHNCVRAELQIGGTAVALYNVHFESPRLGLNALRVVRRKPWYLPQAVQRFENNVEARFSQVRIFQDYIRNEKIPVIVAGDLNAPDASHVCSELRSAGLHDAFAEAGKGYGYSYGHFLLKYRLPELKYSWMRIDHIMMSSHFQTRRCWTGTYKVSDHRPVIADLFLERE